MMRTRRWLAGLFLLLLGLCVAVGAVCGVAAGAGAGGDLALLAFRGEEGAGQAAAAEAGLDATGCRAQAGSQVAPTAASCLQPFPSLPSQVLKREGAQRMSDHSHDTPPDDLSRRDFLHRAAAGSLAAAGLSAYPVAGAAPAQAERQDAVSVTLQVNGQKHELKLDPRVTLLDALREHLGLTGTKKGCDHGQCGACTVLSDGRRIYSRLTLAVMQAGARVTTVEGLADGDKLHPVQAAFLERDAFQCGYCTSGQICSAVGLLNEGHAHSDADIREQMSGNICRLPLRLERAVSSVVRLARDDLVRQAAER
jgi:xanthine dehydrogenase YagT iron-sulfur-binding subunit